MKIKILPALFGLAVTLIANQASAYYSPSTGRWLSRDPNGEPGFETLRVASAVPKVGQVTGSASLAPSRLFSRDSIEAAKSPNAYVFVHNNPQNRIDVLGLSDQGMFGGKCCNQGSQDEWALVNGQWFKLAPGECTGFATDCDGITCHGGFYKVSAMESFPCLDNACNRPCMSRADHYNDPRWTPAQKGPQGVPPGPPDPNYNGEHRGAPNADPPPGYSWKTCSEQKK